MIHIEAPLRLVAKRQRSFTRQGAITGSRRTGLGLIALSWLVTNHYEPWTSVYNEALALLGLMFIAGSVIADAIVRRVDARRAPLSATVVAVVALIPLVQFAFGKVHFSGDALASFLYIAALSAAIAVGFSLKQLQGQAFAIEMAWSVLGAGLVSSVLAMIQALQVEGLGIWLMDMEVGSRASANLAQPNNCATVLMWSSVSLLLLYQRKRIGPFSSALAAMLLVAALSLTQSRMALLCGPIMLIALLVLRRRLTEVQPFLFIGAMTVVHWTASLMWPAIAKTLLLDAAVFAGQAPQSIVERGAGSVRFEMWPRLLDSLWQQRWTGFGWMQTGEAQLLTSTNYAPSSEIWFHAHNLFLDLMLFVGIPVGLVLSGLLVAWLVTRWISVHDIESACALLALTMLGAHAMVELPHYYAYFLVPAGLYAGQVDFERSHFRHAQWLLGSVWIAALAIFFGLCIQYPKAEEDFRTLRFELVGVNAPEGDSPPFDAPLMSGVASYADMVRYRERPGMTRQQLADMEEVVLRFPYSGVISRYVIALALNGREADALTMVAKFRAMYGARAYKGLRSRLEVFQADYPQLKKFAEQLP